MIKTLKKKEKHDGSQQQKIVEKKIILCSYHTHITQAYEKCLFLSSRLYVAHDSETLPEHKDERI